MGCQACSPMREGGGGISPLHSRPPNVHVCFELSKLTKGKLLAEVRTQQRSVGDSFLTVKDTY